MLIKIPSIKNLRIYSGHLKDNYEISRICLFKTAD